MGLTPTEAQFKLKPYSHCLCAKIAPLRNPKERGHYRRSELCGTYAIANNTERISSIIDRAGGLKPSAYLDGAL
ncbi:MAG: hypothetical protein R2822_06745 [Spirosomataceae bacterium]